MYHTLIVHAEMLNRYADRRDSQSDIPELVYLLVRQSVPNTSICRIPYGDSVNQPGWDGIVETASSYREFVPNGTSFWEIGTGNNPQQKATEVFGIRTDNLCDSIRMNSTFVFVTPRTSMEGGWDEPRQTNWIRERQDRGWKNIRVIDGVKLADWMREFPALGRWMANKIGITPTLNSFVTPKEHWDLLHNQASPGDPPIPPALFTEGRTNAIEALKGLFEGNTRRLLLFTESPSDTADFVAAYIATLDDSTVQDYANRCLFVKNEDAWCSFVEVRKPHVLVADPQLGLETPQNADLPSMATQNGHAVVIPLCGSWSTGEAHEVIKLRSPSQDQIESILKEGGYSDSRARELSGYGGDSVAALRRHLQGLGGLPPYVSWVNAMQLAQACLAGKWDGNNTADRNTLEQLLGKDYGEWIETLRPETLRSDSPLAQIDEKWRFIARGEAWNALGNRITDTDLDRFQEAAVEVFCIQDPKFDLAKEERFMSSIHNKNLDHSTFLRVGLAETLALIGSRKNSLTSCSIGKPETIAHTTVRVILNEASWQIWATLDPLLPQLAEAAPDSFLDSVELHLQDLEESLFHRLFAQEGGDELGGWNYVSGLLWALETLAWNPDYLCRVAVALSDLASIDPGGRWANRPSNSLLNIFLPWHVQTCANIEIQQAAVETVLNEHPSVGWNLVMGLLPHSHGFTSGCHKPIWRNYISSEWKEGYDEFIHRELVTIYTSLAIRSAETNTEKLIDLLDRLNDLPTSSQEYLVNHLVSDKLISLIDSARMPIWEKLNRIIRKNRRFPDAKWSMSKDFISELERATEALAPQSPVFRYRYLFNEGIHDLYFSKTVNYEDQRNQIAVDRNNAVQNILSNEGISAVLDFARHVTSPREVGISLGSVESTEIENQVLNQLLGSDGEVEQQIMTGYLWKRYKELGFSWVLSTLEQDWSMEKKGNFLKLLPFESDIWMLADSHLDQDTQKHYWEKVSVYIARPEQEIHFVVGKLIDYGRSPEALQCLYYAYLEKQEADANLAVRTLLSILETPDVYNRVNSDWIIVIIQQLQDVEGLDPDVLFSIEWRFLPLLGQFSSGSPKSLEKQLSSVPGFLAEILSYCYRSKNEEDSSQIESDEHKAALATNAHRLLEGWKICPGVTSDESLDSDVFRSWISEVEEITAQSGHLEHARYHIGKVLVYAPKDPGGLWIHCAVAEVLNGRDLGEMRTGFTSELFNQRGVFYYTAGEEELKLAERFKKKARKLQLNGYSRFATAVRKLAEDYERQAEFNANRNPRDC